MNDSNKQRDPPNSDERALFINYFSDLNWYRNPIKSYFDYRVEEDGYFWYVTSNFASKYPLDVALRNSLVLTYLHRHASVTPFILNCIDRIIQRLTEIGQPAIITYGWYDGYYRIYFQSFSWLGRLLGSLWFFCLIDLYNIHLIGIDLIGEKLETIKVYQRTKEREFISMLPQGVTTEFVLHMKEYTMYNGIIFREKIYFCFDCPVNAHSMDMLNIFSGGIRDMWFSNYNIDFLSIDLNTKKTAIYIEKFPFHHFQT